jgi:hypothetical protein
MRAHLSRAFFAESLERGREQGAILRQSFVPRQYGCHFSNASKRLSLATRKFSALFKQDMKCGIFLHKPAIGISEFGKRRGGIAFLHGAPFFPWE